MNDERSADPAPGSLYDSVLGEAAPVTRVPFRTRTVVLVGLVVWGLLLVVTLVVPDLHTGDRSWWPWTCVTGLALGLFAFWYTATGRGDEAGA